MRIKKQGIIIVLLGILTVNCIDELEEAQSNYLNYNTKINLELPFNGEWLIAHGGRNLSENHHASVREQRFAIDAFQKINGSSYLGDGKDNEDYYCFGKPLFAPGNGIVILVENTVIDNTPGELNPNQLAGNYVVINHQNDEYSFIAHFKQGSIIVNVGDQVVKGQKLGETGNSGNSTEPHLHYHMQTTKNLHNGEGLPAQFLNYYANDVLIERGEPIKNQIVKKK
ncbi:M23 family metallopeptidase [uncultured Maribacter sp.]|uniref:M23 family metallopeptidase n=1 Tax=uncultured Maribacter sp. TaxID=431308 RepID=UPI0026109767|nr:M23 family metallopeptidase [uncultured Maribacter sp.]